MESNLNTVRRHGPAVSGPTTVTILSESVIQVQVLIMMDTVSWSRSESESSSCSDFPGPAKITAVTTSNFKCFRVKASQNPSQLYTPSQARFTGTELANLNVCAPTHTPLCLVVIVRLRVRLRWTLHSREVEGAGLGDILVQQR
jgi:hypothetical protein